MMRLAFLAGCLFGLALVADAATPTLTLKPCRIEHPARMFALPAECGTLTVAGPAPITRAAVAGLTPGTSYTFVVSATNSASDVVSQPSSSATRQAVR